MSMMSSVLTGTGWAARKTIVASSLGLIGVVVGAGCVVLPIAVPFGIVGLAGLILLWTLPDLHSVPSRLARRALVPFLIASACIPFYIAIILPGLPFISIRRLSMFVFAGAFLVTLFGSSANRRVALQRLKQCRALFYAVAGYYALTIATAPLSSAPATTINFLFLNSLAWYLPFLATVFFVETFDDIVRIFRIILFCVFIDFVTGGIEYYLQHPFMIYALSDEAIAQLMADNPLFSGLSGSGRFGQYRAESAFSNPLGWAEMLAMAAPLATWMVIHPLSRRDRLWGWPGCFAVLLSLMFAHSRGGYVCTLGAIAAFMLVWAIRQHRLRPENLFGGIALLLASASVAIGAAAVLLVPALRIRVLGGGAVQISNAGRAVQWAIAWPKILGSPIWGHGFGTAGQGNDFNTVYGAVSIDDYRIILLLDNGVLGFTLFFGALAIAIWMCFRIYISNRSPNATLGAALGCALLAYAVDRTTLSLTENNTMMFVLLGLVFALHRLASAEAAAAQPQKTSTEDVPDIGPRRFATDRAAAFAGNGSSRF